MYNQGSMKGKQPEDRSARIERQHSQEMALRYLALLGWKPPDSDKINDTTATDLTSVIDWFEKDISNSVALRKEPTLSLDDASLLVDKIVGLDEDTKRKVVNHLRQMLPGTTIHSKDELFQAVANISVQQAMLLALEADKKFDFDKAIT